MKKLLLAGLMIILCVSISASASAEKIQSWLDIPQEAITEEGLARVIIVFEVPGISALTKDSALAKDGTTFQTPEEADAALNSAIHRAGDQLLQRLESHTKSKEQAYTLHRRFDFLPLLAMEISRDVFLAFSSDSQVKQILLDTPTPLPIPPPVESAPSAGSEDDELTTSDVMSLIGADKAWARGYTGTDWYVAILDTGIRASHELFSGKDIVEACFSDRGHCPNEATTMTGPGSAAHLSDEFWNYDHGTHVAGTAAGLSPDGNVTGVAKDAHIIAVNIFSGHSPEECDMDDPCIMSNSSDIVAALLYIYSLRNSYKIGAVNMSLGGGRYSEYCDDKNNYPRYMAINLLKEASIPTVIASGNDTYCGYVNSPACISPAITVMASTRSDMEVKFSNWHPTMGNIFAPGQKILSAVGSGDEDYEKWNGTSMAAPHVAGAMTLMRQARPFDSPDALFSRLIEHGVSITTPCPDGGSQKRLFVDNFYSPREEADMLFNRLEREYPDILFPLPAPTQVSDGYIYRHYTGKNVYLAVHDGMAFFIDEQGNTVELGPVDHLAYP